MKANAIIRIIVWSLTIIVLLSIILAVISFDLYRYNAESILQNVAIDRGELTLEEDSPAATIYIDQTSEFTFDSNQIHEIEINWAAGSILIMPHDVEKIEVSESGNNDPKYAMECYLKHDKLIINFSEKTKYNNRGFGITLSEDLSKDLRILVPRDWNLNTLEINAASAKLEVCDMTIYDVEIDTASGICEFENCNVDTIDLDTASGDIKFVGTLNILDCDAASANVVAILSNTPSQIDMDSMSGDLDITLPPDCGFTVSTEGLTSDFSSDFSTTMKNGNHIHGDGRCRIDVDAMSGDVTIRKAE